jgi:hypothetical protein
MTVIAATVVTKAVEGLGEAGKSAVSALVRLVRRKLSPRGAAQDVLERAEHDPTDRAQVLALAEELRRAATEDHLFAAELDRLWRDVLDERPVVNSISGKVRGNVVQARDIGGDVTFG